MVHMEHMAVVSGQLRLAEQPLNLNWAILSYLSLPIEVTLIPFQFFNYNLIVKYPINSNRFYDFNYILKCCDRVIGF